MNIRKKILYSALFVSVFSVAVINVAPNSAVDGLEDKKLIDNNYITSEILEKDMTDYGDVNVKADFSKLESDLENTIKNMALLVSDSFGTQAMRSLEREIINIIRDDELSRQQKMTLLWSVAKLLGFDTEEGRYILEYLSVFSPVELIDPIAGIFPTASENLKSTLLDLLESTQFFSGELNENSKVNVEIGRDKVSELLMSEVSTIENKEQKFKVLQILTITLPFDEAKNVIEEQFSLLNGDVSNEEKAGVYNRLALATSESRNEFLPNYIESIRNDPSLDYMSQSLQSDLFGILELENAFDGETNEFKEVVLGFLNEQGHDLESKANWSYDEFELYNNLTVAQIKLGSNDSLSFKDKLGKAVSQEGGALKQAILISHSSINVKELIPDNYSRMNMVVNLESSLKKFENSRESNDVILSAIGILESSIR